LRTIHCPAARASLALDVGAWLKRLASGRALERVRTQITITWQRPGHTQTHSGLKLSSLYYTARTQRVRVYKLQRSRYGRAQVAIALLTGIDHVRALHLCNVCSEQQAHSYSKAVCAVRAHAHADALRPQTFNRLVSVPIRACLPCLSCSRLALVPQTVRSPTCDLCPSAHARHGSEEHRPNSRAAEMYIRTVFLLPPCPCLSSGATPRKKCTFAPPSSSRHALASRAGQRRVKRAFGLCP
jgi:hypothetical protein